MHILAIVLSVLLVCGLGEKCSGSKAQVGKKLEIVSAPDGASVKLDGVAKGKTPLTIEDLDVVEGQEQTVVFELEGYMTVEKTLKWTSAEQSLSATLEKAARERVITVKSDPSGAGVYADGEPKGDTPTTWSVELEDGAEINVLVQKKGYSDITERISFADEKTKTLEYTFLKEGKLKYVDLDKVLLRQEKRWRKACKTISSDVCKFKYTVDKEGNVTKVTSVSCSDAAINGCTKKMVQKMKFPAAEQGRNDNFTWYGY
jgi:uncharacterized cupredoxin-like copper-binding protein